jgi:hypothetical protein
MNKFGEMPYWALAEKNSAVNNKSERKVNALQLLGPGSILQTHCSTHSAKLHTHVLTNIVLMA